MGDGGRRESKWEAGREREWFKYQPLRGCVILFSANAAAVKPWPVSHSRQQPPEERSIRTLAGPLTRTSVTPLCQASPRRDFASDARPMHRPPIAAQARTALSWRHCYAIPLVPQNMTASLTTTAAALLVIVVLHDIHVPHHQLLYLQMPRVSQLH